MMYNGDCVCRKCKPSLDRAMILYMELQATIILTTTLHLEINGKTKNQAKWINHIIKDLNTN